MTTEHPRSYWLQEALADEQADVSPLRADTTCDVCIVGGGYTGLWTALQLKEAEPALDVVLIERDLCASGASGRNGGFLVSWWAKFMTLEKICGAAEGLRLARACDAALGDIATFCTDHNIDAQLRRDGWLWAATSAAQVGAWSDTVAALARHDEHPFVDWSPEEVAARSGSSTHIAGIFDRSAGSLQPALLGRGLRRVALERGVRIFEHTPLTALDLGVPAVVHTPHGLVRAERVVIAMNAWAARWAEIRKSIAVVSGDIVMTPPIAEQLERIGWNDGLGISDGRALVHYYRTTSDGRIAFGKGGMCGEFCYGGNIGHEVEGASPMAASVQAAFQRTYPALADVEMATSWRGPVDRSHSGLPIFWHLGRAKNVFYGVGFSGNGVGPCHVAGRILASLALGRQDEWSGCGLVRAPTRDYPPEPFRYFGSKLLRRALLAGDKAEDEGRAPPLSARLMARFAPAGVSPFKVEVKDKDPG